MLNENNNKKCVDIVANCVSETSKQWFAEQEGISWAVEKEFDIYLQQIKITSCLFRLIPDYGGKILYILEEYSRL